MAGWYYLSFLTQSRDSGSLFRMIDNVDANSGIRSGADDLLMDIYKRQVVGSGEPDYLKVSLVKLYGKDFVNLVSLKKNWKGQLRASIVQDAEEIQFDLYIQFEKTEEYDVSRFGADLIGDKTGRYRLGFVMEKQKYLMRFYWVETDIKNIAKGVIVGSPVGSGIFKRAPNDFFKIHVSVNRDSVHCVINNQLRYSISVPPRLMPFNILLFPHVANGNVSFRMENTQIKKRAYPVFNALLKLIPISGQPSSGSDMGFWIRAG